MPFFVWLFIVTFLSRLFVVIGEFNFDFRCWFCIAFKFLFLLLLCILFTNCNRIPLFDLAAIAIAFALKRLCEVWFVRFSRLFVVIVEFDYWFLVLFLDFDYALLSRSFSCCCCACIVDDSWRDYCVRLDCDCDCVESFARVKLWCGECWILQNRIFVDFVRLWYAQCYFIAPTLTCNQLYSTTVRCFFVLPTFSFNDFCSALIRCFVLRNRISVVIHCFRLACHVLFCAAEFQSYLISLYIHTRPCFSRILFMLFAFPPNHKCLFNVMEVTVVSVMLEVTALILSWRFAMMNLDFCGTEFQFIMLLWYFFL